MSYRLNTDVAVSQTRRELVSCLGKWRGAELVSIADPKDLPDERAIVVFDFNGQRVRVEYSDQWNYRSNLRAVYLTLEGLRLAYARGLGDVLINTVSQMLALPGAQYIDPYELLGVRPDAELEDIESMYLIKSKRAHPDKGGTVEQQAQLNAAIERIREDRAVVA